MLHSSDVPQANDLTDVVKTVEAVANGATTYQDIAAAIGKVERQGRYYRLAAEQIGLIMSVGTNHSVLTQAGKSFLSLDHHLRRPSLAHSVLGNSACSNVYYYILNHPNCTLDDLENHLILEGLAESISIRRRSTILNWLLELELIDNNNQTYTALWKPSHQGSIIEWLTESLAYDIYPQINSALHDAEAIWDGNYNEDIDGDITFQISREARESATKSHQNLVITMADAIRGLDAEPMMTVHIDLFALFNNKSNNYLFEMKSCTDKNMISQMRKGLTQLYEYRYRYKKDIPDPELWLVLDKKPDSALDWYLDFLVIDRSINICWLSKTNDFQTYNICQDRFNTLMQK
ncbi:MAG: hypothetical protein CVV02_05910 [Firmicutes bacterium HGW-Firmicutes-7]|nr:MAG: hypothetical protein CVV02_05910 [Firmicutes bacterium HGW-Firmicutes-7]